MTNRRPLIIFGLAAIVLLICFMIFGKGGNRYDWSETYQEESKEPYGTYIVHNLLSDYFPNHSLQDIQEGVAKELPDSTDSPANYVFIGEGQYMDTADVTQLLAFVENGNNAFIASKSIPHDLMFYVYYEECNDNYWNDYSSLDDTIVALNLLHRDLEKKSGFEYRFLKRNLIKNYRWQYIDSLYFCDEAFSFVELGAINDQYINFAKINYGAGTFYFHTNPIAFTNLQLLDQQGLAYASKIFSHLSEGPVYWDRYSRVAESISRRRNQMASYNPERELSSEGPLSYILDQPSLTWAWYLLVALGLLYLVFRAKRKQRIIPVYEGNKNTSLEFISTIGTLYFLQNDHKKLCEQKMRLFLSYVRERYHVATKEIDNDFVTNLSIRSEVPEATLNTILKYFKNIESSNFVSENTMVDFHLAMDQFYKLRK